MAAEMAVVKVEEKWLFGNQFCKCGIVGEGLSDKK